MAELSSSERAVVERAGAEPMLDQVLGWAAVNSGSRNLAGLERMADLLVDAFAALPGAIRLERPAKVESVDSGGRVIAIEHGRHLHLTVRPTAPLQLLFTGHMDTVYGADHAFQETRWIEDGVLNGPGVADMKGGLAVMLAALKAVENSKLADRIGYEVIVNSDEEVGSLASAALLAQAAQGKRAALTYEPAALPDGTLAGARPGSGNFDFVVHGRSAHAGLFRAGGGHFVDQHVGTRRMVDEVRVGPRIARDHHRMSRVVDPVTERRLEQRAVVHEEGRDHDAAPVEDHAFRDVARIDQDALRRQVLFLAAHADVPRIGFPQVGHHRLGACRAPDFERRGPPAEGRRDPARQPEVGDAHGMVGMEMRQEERIDLAERDPQLP